MSLLPEELTCNLDIKEIVGINLTFFGLEEIPRKPLPLFCLDWHIHSTIERFGLEGHLKII